MKGGAIRSRSHFEIILGRPRSPGGITVAGDLGPLSEEQLLELIDACPASVKLMLPRVWRRNSFLLRLTHTEMQEDRYYFTKKGSEKPSIKDS